jgi:hypothetical protein
VFQGGSTEPPPQTADQKPKKTKSAAHDDAEGREDEDVEPLRAGLEGRLDAEGEADPRGRAPEPEREVLQASEHRRSVAVPPPDGKSQGAAVEALLDLLKDPASQTTALWLIVALLSISHLNQRELFRRQKDTETDVATLKGNCQAAERLNNCPLTGLREKLEHCPLLEEIERGS